MLREKDERKQRVRETREGKWGGAKQRAGLQGMDEQGERSQGGGQPRPYYTRARTAAWYIVGAGLAPALVSRNRWRTLVLCAIVLILVAVAIGMRLYQLGLPFDRDSYDEGVYWQSLRAMGAGYPLYQEIFYSQPPFFLLSTFPSYLLFGSTLESARLGIVLVSLLGLGGAFVLGKALSGRLGAVAALLLLVVNPSFLAQSQTIQAEASSVAFSLLAVGFAYLWWEQPEGRAGLWWAVLTGITLSLSILCKLLTVACIAPIGFLILARLWQNWQKDKRVSFATLWPIAAGIVAFLGTSLLVLLPFFGSFSAFVQSVITFHTDAGVALGSTQQGNTAILEPAFTSLLALTAFYGTIVALVRRDWRVVPLLVWLLGTGYLLWHQVPLFTHHLIALVPPFIGLAVVGIGKQSEEGDEKADAKSSKLPRYKGSPLQNMLKYAGWLALLLVLLTAVLDVRADRQYYRVAAARGVDGLAKQEARVASDLRNAITAGQFVVTDAQFIAGLADRNTLPSLVDTSAVRINTGYLTVQQLILLTSEDRVHAVLFFTGRFYLPKVASFHAWVAQHFRLLHNYGSGQELWVR